LKKKRLNNWIAGQERFRAITASYYRGANGFMFVYDITNKASFLGVEHWIQEAAAQVEENDAVRVLLGNKLDMEDNRKVRYVCRI
jgi:GTPase SAR1 family protein